MSFVAQMDATKIDNIWSWTKAVRKLLAARPTTAAGKKTIQSILKRIGTSKSGKSAEIVVNMQGCSEQKYAVLSKQLNALNNFGDFWNWKLETENRSFSWI